MVKDGLDDTISIRGNEGNNARSTPGKSLTFLKTKSSFSECCLVTQKINDGYVKMDQFINSKFELNTLELIDQCF